MQFDPQETSLDKPKHGQEDTTGVAHAGGNTFAGGVRIPCYSSSSRSLIQLKTGGRDTAGLGGRGGYERLYKNGHDIRQVCRGSDMAQS